MMSLMFTQPPGMKLLHTHTHQAHTYTHRLDVLAAGKFKVSQQFHQRRDKTRAAQAAVAASG